MMFQLTTVQIANAIERADIETDIAIEKKLDPQFDQDKLTPEQNRKNRRRGIMGQQAVREYFGMNPLEPPWDKVEIWEGRRKGDIGKGCEVRATEYKTGQMLLHKVNTGHWHGDEQEPWLSRNYILVIMAEDGRYRMPGWLPMKLALTKWEDFEKGHYPCMGVRQKYLWRINGLMIEENGTQYWSKVV